MEYWNTFANKFLETLQGFPGGLVSLSVKNYYFWFIGISIFFFLLENVKPWRKNQARFRRDFWLDVFYMFFNIVFFSALGFTAASHVLDEIFNDLLMWAFGIENLLFFHLEKLPWILYILVIFVISDFLSYWVHRLLHWVPFLWDFHKVHHSVAEMGFAAHLRYHWMENVVYKMLKYIPLTMIGYGLQDLFIVYVFELAWGHFNHANFTIPLGPLKYVFNNPKMHIWHHAKELPPSRRFGINFGLTLSVWDYLFGTAHIPSDGRDITLGFEDVEKFPKGFVEQQLYPLTKK